MASRDLGWYRSFTSESRNMPNFRGLSPEKREAEAQRLYANHQAEQESLALAGRDTDLADDQLVNAIERRYREAHNFDTPAAEAQLRGIVALEVEQAKITRRLAGKTTERQRAALLTDLRQVSQAHRDLVVSAGLDRKSLETAKVNQSPMEKMDEQIHRFAVFMKDRQTRLPAMAASVGSERDLRELVKYLTGWPFEIVDAIIANTKRLNGLPATVEHYE